eukprot:6153_1
MTDKLLLYDAKINSLSTNMEQILKSNKEKDKQIQLLKEEIKILNDNNKEMKQEINYQMTLNDAKIKSVSSNYNNIKSEIKLVNDNNIQIQQEMREKSSLVNAQLESFNNKIIQLIEEEKKENNSNILNEINKLKKEMNE